MERRKAIIIVQSVTIVVLLGIVVLFAIQVKSSNYSKQIQYCEKYSDTSGLCLLSPRVYTKIIPAKSYMILNFDYLQKDLENYIRKNQLNLSVYVINLRDDANMGINAKVSYPAASLNKLPIAVAVVHKIENGNLSLDTELEIKDDHRDLSSGPLYNTPATNMSVRELLHYMLSYSDNTALWTLSDAITKEDFVAVANYLGYYSNSSELQQPVIRNTDTTAKDVSNAFLSLYLSTAMEPQHAEMLLNFLSNSSFDIHRYAKLPSDVIVAQKDGFQYAQGISFFHDCGIIYLEDSRFSYCVMTKDLGLEKAPQVIGDVVNRVYNFIVEGRKMQQTGI